MTTASETDAGRARNGVATAREPLSRERIVSAAVDFVDSHCVADLSMRKLGARLGVEAMSLYRYVPSKAALLDAVVDQLVTDIAVPRGGDWTDAVRAYADSFRAVARSHPRMLPLLAAAGASHPGVRRVVDALHAHLRRAGFSDELAFHALCAIQGYTIGTTVWQIGGSVFRPPDTGERGDPCRTTQDALSYPAFAAFVDNDTDVGHGDVARRRQVGLDPDHEFRFGLEVVLDGLQRKLADEGVAPTRRDARG